MGRSRRHEAGSAGIEASIGHGSKRLASRQRRRAEARPIRQDRRGEQTRCERNTNDGKQSGRKASPSRRTNPAPSPARCRKPKGHGTKARSRRNQTSPEAKPDEKGNPKNPPQTSRVTSKASRCSSPGRPPGPSLIRTVRRVRRLSNRPNGGEPKSEPGQDGQPPAHPMPRA